MANFNKMVKSMSQQVSEQSVSWGSLFVWICGLAVVMSMMVSFSQS